MRELQLLATLKECGTYMNITALSELLHVSQRTIMNDLKLLNQDGERYGFSIKVKRGEGYYLEIQDEAAFQSYMQMSDDVIGYDADERAAYIVSTLLLSNEYITQDTLADALDVSKSIIKADMIKVQDLLMDHHIMIEKKAHYGIRIMTRSLHRKQYLQELYEEGNKEIVERIESICGSEFKEIEKLLISELKRNHLTCNYNELKKMDAFLKITIYTHMHSLYEETPFLESKNSYYDMAKKLGEAVEKRYGIMLLESEIHDLGFYIKVKTKNIEHTRLYSEQLKEEIEAFLTNADQEYHTSFNEDEQFKESLLAHVSLLLDRLHQSITFSNPLVQEISVKYPVIFNLAIQFTAQLEKRYHVDVTQDEIGFIATHFAAHMEKEARDKLSRFNKIAILCSSGGGSAFLIKLKLESIFPSSRIQTFSLMEQEEVKDFHPDIIFTITELEEQYDVPIIKIKELLDDSDIMRIKNMFGLAEKDLVANVAGRLFRKDCFTILHDQQDYLALLKTMGKEVEKQGFAQHGYAGYVLEREQFLSTIYHNGVAIPHPINMCGIVDVVSVAICKQPIPHVGKSAKLIFMVSLRKSSMELHQQITRVLFDVMGDERMVERLQGVSSFEEFMIQMKEMNW